LTSRGSAIDAIEIRRVLEARPAVRYLIAILLPPLGMLLVGKVLEAIVCLLLMLTVIGHPIAAIWAVLVVHGSLADDRTRRIEEAMRRAANG
jgi:uncharacterized membrane protein YqaE (UPF0057 family)